MFAIASLFAIVGGFLDAYSYLARGRVFAGAQTGNVVLFGVRAAAGNCFARAVACSAFVTVQMR